MNKLNTYRSGVDENGHFGIYGGRYVAEVRGRSRSCAVVRSRTISPLLRMAMTITAPPRSRGAQASLRPYLHLDASLAEADEVRADADRAAGHVREREGLGVGLVRVRNRVRARVRATVWGQACA